MDLVECERGIRGGAGGDPFDDEILNFSLHCSFPIEGGLLVCYPSDVRNLPGLSPGSRRVSELSQDPSAGGGL